jgi:O-methyltransferase
MDCSQLLPIAYCNDVKVLELTDQLCRAAIEKDIAGAFVEAGTAYGAHGVIMAQYDRAVILFDSFDGIPQYTKEDVEFTESYGESAGDVRKSSGITVCRLEDVKETMQRYGSIDNVAFVKGWFADTLPKFYKSPCSIAVLRLDCDIYHSYADCFKYLLPLVSDGGYLIIDDYCLAGCQQAMAEAGLDHNKFTKFNNIAWATLTKQQS